MSVAVLIVTHGQSAEALLKTAEMIIGKQDNLVCLDFNPGENADVLVEKIRRAMQDINSEQGILFLVDLWGGTPFNAVSILAEEIKNSALVAGVNVPMLVETLMQRDEIGNLDDLVVVALQSGIEGVRSPKHAISSNNKESCALDKTSTKLLSEVDESDPEIKKLREEESRAVKSRPHMKLGLVRIDDRLIHGQVATRWVKEVVVNRIIVVNDEVAKDALRVTMLKQAVPPGISAHVVSLDKMMRVYNNPDYAEDRVMLLFTCPQDVLRLVERGIPIQSVNIGGIAFKEDKQMLDFSVALNDDDVGALKALAERNIELEIRQVPSDNKVNVMDLIAEKYKTASR